MFFVYRVNGPTGSYIGKSKDPAVRWKSHKRNHRYEDSRFYRALRKHGVEQFTLEVIATARTEADSFSCEKTIILQERALGERLYNISDGGKGNAGTPILTPETRLKLSLATKGKPKSAEHRARIAAGHRGIRPGEITRQKISAAAKARWAALPRAERVSHMQYVRSCRA